MSPEEGAARAAAFGAWMQRVGTGLVDVGCPFGDGATVRDDGLEGTAHGLIGYSIIEAADIDAAKALTNGLPFLAGSNGECTVEIYELQQLG